MTSPWQPHWGHSGVATEWPQVSLEGVTGPLGWAPWPWPLRVCVLVPAVSLSLSLLCPCPCPWHVHALVPPMSLSPVCPCHILECPWPWCVRVLVPAVSLTTTCLSPCPCSVCPCHVPVPVPCPISPHIPGVSLSLSPPCPPRAGWTLAGAGWGRGGPGATPTDHAHWPHPLSTSTGHTC